MSSYTQLALPTQWGAWPVPTGVEQIPGLVGVPAVPIRGSGRYKRLARGDPSAASTLGPLANLLAFELSDKGFRVAEKRAGRAFLEILCDEGE
jgi:hypothetical protein